MIFICLILTVIGIFLSLITIQKPNGEFIRSDWPKNLQKTLMNKSYL